MPELTSQVSEGDVQEAFASFYDDFGQVMQFHDVIQQMAPYIGRNSQYDAGLKTIVDRQNELMFELRNLYADMYPSLNPTQQSLLYNWIVKATGQLRTVSDTLGNLGIAPIIIIAGVAITALTATALVAWHRQISLQREALKQQAALIPLVAEGKVPADVLKPMTSPSISQTISTLGSIVMWAVGIWAALKLYEGSKKS